MHESNSDTKLLIAISKPAARVVVGYQGRTIADTENALFLEERGYPPVFYVPIRDVDLSYLEPSTTVTFCPRKGRAAHHHLVVDGQRSIDAAWTYAEPLSEVDAILDHFAFYEDRVDELSVNVTNTL
jgi:uncharacterized protein (DUF427 family)